MKSPHLLQESGTDSEVESNKDHELEEWTAQPQKDLIKQVKVKVYKIMMLMNGLKRHW